MKVTTLKLINRIDKEEKEKEYQNANEECTDEEEVDDDDDDPPISHANPTWRGTPPTYAGGGPSTPGIHCGTMAEGAGFPTALPL